MKTGNLSIFDTILNDFTSDVRFRRNYVNDYDVHKTEDGGYYVFSVPGFNKSNLKVEVDDTIIEDTFCNFKTTKTADKAKIKEAIKSGAEVVGAVLNVNFNLQIK